MTITLNQKQMDFLKSTAINTGFVAGLGSGKSYIATLKTIIKKINHPELTVAYYLPTYGLIRDIAFDKFPSMLSEMGYEYKLNKSDKEIHIKDYGKIIFRSMDNPETIVGYEVFYSIIDECDILPQDKMTIAYNKIMARNRQKCMKGTVNQIDVASTPEGFKWFYKRYVEQFNKETDLLVRASTYENKHLPPQYITNLEQQYPPNLLKAYLNGEFVNLSSANVYSYFNRETHHSNIEATENETLFIGQDFNYNSCVSIIFVRRENHFIAVDEIISKDTKSVVDNLKYQYPNNYKIIYPDASGKNNKTSAAETDIAILRNAGFTVYVNNSNPYVKDRVNIVNNCFDKMKVLVNTNRCKRLTESLEQQAYDIRTGEPEKSNDHPSKDDFCDSFGYLLSYEFPITQRHSTAKLMGI